MRLDIRLLFGFWIGCGVACADDQVSRLFSRARAVNPGLRDFQAEVVIDMQATIGPLSCQPKGRGTYFYKREGLHRLDVLEGPRQLKKYPMVFGFNLPPLEEYNSSVVEETSYKGRPVFHCLLTSKSSDQSLAQIDMLVDKENYSVPNYVNRYRNQGRLQVDIDFTHVDNYLVFDRMRAQADFPSAGTSASGEARYSHYLFNQNLSDRLFPGARLSFNSLPSW